MHGHVRACSKSAAQQTTTTAAGLELGSDDGLDGAIAFDVEQSRAGGSRDWFARKGRAAAPTVAVSCLEETNRAALVQFRCRVGGATRSANGGQRAAPREQPEVRGSADRKRRG